MRPLVRAAMAVMVLVGVGYFFVVPAQTYLSQKTAISQESHALSVLQAQDRKLREKKAALNNDGTLAQMARQDYGLVKPGQQAFMVLPSTPAPAPPHKRARPSHWYSGLEFWHKL